MSASVETRPLKRSLRVTGNLLLTLSAVTPASSVFVIVPGVIAQAGTGAFLSMVLGAILSLPIAYIYAELSSAFPISGGEYSIAGRTINGDAGIIVLWLNAFSSVLTPAVFALGTSAFIGVVIPGLNTTYVAVAIILVTTVLGILHIRTNAWITGVFLLLELLALAALTVAGLWHVHRSLWDIGVHPLLLAGDALKAAPLTVIGASSAISIFAYNGYGSAVYFSEEMHQPRTAIARTIMLALVISVVTELVPVTAVLLGAPDLVSLLKSQTPFNDFLEATGGHRLNAVISISVALAIFNAILATVLQNARFFYCTGRDGTWHPRFNKAFTAIHPKFHSPWLGTLIAGIVSLLMCFLGLDLILVLTGTGIVFVYIALCIGAIAGRRTGATDHAVYRMPLYPLWPVMGLIALLYVLYTSALDPDLGQPSLIANAVVAVLALLYYRLVIRRKRDWVLTDAPEDFA